MTQELRSILLVDDDPLVLAGFREILSRDGYAVTAVFSGREAMERLDQAAYDVVLTDLLMPRVSGLDVLRHAREKQPATVVIVVTGYASVRSAVEALRLGAHDYLIKPCDEQELLFRVKMGMEHVQLQRDLHERELDSEKMKAIAQTAITVNDQINTPLNVILNSAEFIRLKTRPETDDVQQSLDFIGQEVNKIKAVIQRLARIADPKIKEYSNPAVLMVDIENSGQRDSEPDAPRGKKRILVVDDELYMVHTLARILEALGYDVVRAFGGREALRVCNSQAVDLVVTDLHMPDMNGLELLNALKTSDPQLPVILVTGFGVEEARESVSKWKADGFLGKPFTVTELQGLIDQTLGPSPSRQTNSTACQAAVS